MRHVVALWVTVLAVSAPVLSGCGSSEGDGPVQYDPTGSGGLADVGADGGWRSVGDAGTGGRASSDGGGTTDTAMSQPDVAATDDTGPDPVEDTGPDPVEDTGPDPVEDTGPDPVEDTGPDPLEDTGPGPVEDAVEPGPTGTPGCGLAAQHAAGGIQVTINAGKAGDGDRGFWLSLPATYDPNTEYKLYVGYAGTSWYGEWIQPYLELEDGQAGDEIYVYPDPLWRDFEGWGNMGGWLLGPHAYPAHGEQDMVFTEALLDYMEQNYCIDTDRVFATGHSWGGDMAQIVACFMGDRFTASAPIAANRPYWFETAGGGLADCIGNTAVWTFFGANDEHFSWQTEPGEFGDECRDFWLQEKGCDGAGAYQTLGLGDSDWECVSFDGCTADTRYCLYGAQYGHQKPDYFGAAAMSWFRSF